MKGLEESINILKQITGLDAVAYWVKEDSYIFKTPTTGMKDCSFYKVEGSRVTPTNPLLSHLDIKDARIL